MTGPLFISKRCSLPRQPPLPIFNFDETGSLTYASPRPAYKGIFTGFNVIIRAQDVMINLYTKGYFGKGNLSPGYPSYQKRLMKAYEERKIEGQVDEPTGEGVLGRLEEEGESSKNLQQTLECDEDEICRRNADSEKPDEASEITKEVCNFDELRPKFIHSRDTSIDEELHLFLEEAFFLSHTLDCLEIFSNDLPLSPQDAWIVFQNVQSNFIERYVAYHHFRTKGWVVRSGLKFGGDYVLYKDGPPFYHATYVVFVVSNENVDINFFLACYRAVEVTKKELLICRVKIPDCDEKVTNLDCLKACQVSEFTLKRWLPSENR